MSHLEMSRQSTFTELADSVLDELVSAFGVSTVFIARDDGITTDFIKVHNRELPIRLVSGLVIPSTESYCGHVCRNNETTIFTDITKDPRTAQMAITRYLESGAYIGVPLRYADGTVFGTLCAFGSSPQEFERHEIQFIESLSRVLTWALERERSESLFRHIVDSASIGYMVVRQGTVVYQNDAFATLTEEISTMDLTSSQISRFTRSDGRVFDVQQTRERFARGEYDVYRAIDISDLIQTVESEKLSVIGEMAAGIAHEVRNPLTSIKGFFQLVSDDPTRINPALVDVISREISQIELLSGEMLALSPHTARFTPIDIRSVLRDVVLLLERELDLARVHVVMDFVSQSRLHGDVNGLKQVFLNLFENAIEAMPNGGTITVRLDSTTTAVWISVQDTGSGMSTETLRTLGTPFKTSKDGGTGLGVVVCQKIIAGHGGTMDFTSEPDHGTLVKISLPITD